MAAIAAPEVTSVSVQLPADLYEDVRELLADTGNVNPEAVDKFVQAAVSNYLLRKSTSQLREATSHIPDDDLYEWAAESVKWARLQK